MKPPKPKPTMLIPPARPNLTRPRVVGEYQTLAFLTHFNDRLEREKEAARKLDPRDLENPPHEFGRWTPNL